MMQDNVGDTAPATTGDGMVVRKMLDMVAQCYTYEDGQVVALAIRAVLRDGGSITLDCDGADSFSTSFVNGAFVDLLDEFSMEALRARLKVTNNLPFNNNLVKMRFVQTGLVVQ